MLALEERYACFVYQTGTGSSHASAQGTVRRKKKVIHRTATTDDKKLQNTLKKLTVNPIPGIEEVSSVCIVTVLTQFFASLFCRST